MVHQGRPDGPVPDDRAVPGIEGQAGLRARQDQDEDPLGDPAGVCGCWDLRIGLEQRQQVIASRKGTCRPVSDEGHV